MEIKFAGHLSVAGLLKLSIPSVIMMVFTSIYGVVDGFCVSNYVGKAAFTAVNFIIPFLMMLGAVGFMFGTGGGALIARSMGEGRHELANRLFSMLVYVSLSCWPRWDWCFWSRCRVRSAQKGSCLKTASGMAA